MEEYINILNDWGKNISHIKKGIIINTNKCEQCNSTRIINDGTLGVKQCINCGYIIERLFDCTQEWSNFEDKNETARCSTIFNKLLPQSSMGTNIVGSGKIKMLHKWNAMPYNERSLSNVFKIIHEKCVISAIPKRIEDDAKIMYKMVSESKHTGGINIGKRVITRGINRESIIAASVFFACRRNNITRSPKEIATLFELYKTDLNKGTKNFIKLLRAGNNHFDMGISEIKDFVKRKCDELNLITEYTEQAMTIANNLDKLNIASNHTTYSLAAASILLVGNLNNLDITLSKVARIFDISDITIIKTYKKIEKYKNIIQNNSIVELNIKNINTIDKELQKKINDKMVEFGLTSKDINIDKSVILSKINLQ